MAFTFLELLKKLSINVHEWDDLPELPITISRIAGKDGNEYLKMWIKFNSYSELFSFFEKKIPKAIKSCEKLGLILKVP